MHSGLVYNSETDTHFPIDSKRIFVQWMENTGHDLVDPKLLLHIEVGNHFKYQAVGSERKKSLVVLSNDGTPEAYTMAWLTPYLKDLNSKGFKQDEHRGPSFFLYESKPTEVAAAKRLFNFASHIISG